MVRLVRWVRALLLSVSLAGCFDLSGESSQDEVARVPDPAGGVDAVLLEWNGGATTSFGYAVYVVPRGQIINPAVDSAVASLYAAVRSGSAYGVNLRWSCADQLDVEYLDARQATRDSIITIGPRTVRIVLRPGIANPHAPAGGMLYNLRGRSH